MRIDDGDEDDDDAMVHKGPLATAKDVQIRSD